MGALYPVL